MNIAVMSPHTTKNGNTTIAALLAYELSMRNRKVCLTHATSKSNAFFTYFHIEDNEDKTANPIEITNLIREGGLRKNDIGDYCKSIKENLELFTMNSCYIVEDNFIDVLEFICNSFPYDYTVFDMDTNDIESKASKMILKYCDCIVYVFTQNCTEFIEFKENKARYLPYMRKVPNIVIVNQYNNIIGSIEDIARGIGMKKANKWLTVSYNPYIAWGTSHGQLADVFQYMKNRDYRLVDIDTEIKTLVSAVMNIKQAKRAKRYTQYDKNNKERFFQKISSNSEYNCLHDVDIKTEPICTLNNELNTGNKLTMVMESSLDYNNK